MSEREGSGRRTSNVSRDLLSLFVKKSSDKEEQKEETLPYLANLGLRKEAWPTTCESICSQARISPSILERFVFEFLFKLLFLLASCSQIIFFCRTKEQQDP